MKVIIVNKLNPNHTKQVDANNVGILLSGNILSNYSIIAYPPNKHPVLIEPSTIGNDVISIQKVVNETANIQTFKPKQYPRNKFQDPLNLNMDINPQDNLINNVFLDHSE